MHNDAQYQLIAVEICKEIASGELRPGGNIPTTSQIGDRYGVSPTVAQEVRRQLCAWRLTEPVQGRKTPRVASDIMDNPMTAALRDTLGLLRAQRRRIEMLEQPSVNRD